MRKDEVSNLLFEIMRKILYYVPLTEETFQKGIDAPLTGDYWDFNAVQMVYLFCEVEKAFQIRIQPQKLNNYGFNTIRKINNLIVNSCQQTIANEEEIL